MYSRILTICLALLFIVSCSSEQAPEKNQSIADSFPTQIATTYADDGIYCDFSGRIILSESNSEPGIFTLRGDGRRHRLSESWDTVHQGSIQGDTVIYTRWQKTGALLNDIPTGIHNIYKFNLNSGEETKLTKEGHYYDPVISIDGRIAVGYQPEGVSQIAILNAKGELEYTISSDYHLSEPAWSPRGTHIAFVQANDSDNNSPVQWEIVVAKANGSNKKTIYATEGIIRHLSWNPEGNYLLFSSSTNDQRYDIFTINLTSGEIVRIGGVKNETNPVWSPSGEMIAYISSEDGSIGSDVYIMNKDGTNACRAMNALSSNTLIGWTTNN